MSTATPAKRSPFPARLTIGTQEVAGLLDIAPLKNTNGFKGEWKWSFVQPLTQMDVQSFYRLSRGGFSTPERAMNDAQNFGVQFEV